MLVAHRAQVPPGLRINAVIYDDSLSVDEVVNADGDVLEFVYSTNRADLARLATAYSRLCAHAREWIPGEMSLASVAATPVLRGEIAQ